MCNTTGPGRAPVAEDFGADLQQRVELQSRLGRQMCRCIDASRGNGSAAGVEPHAPGRAPGQNVGVRSRQVFGRRLLVVAAERTGCANGGAVALRQKK